MLVLWLKEGVGEEVATQLCLALVPSSVIRFRCGQRPPVSREQIQLRAGEGALMVSTLGPLCIKDFPALGAKNLTSLLSTILLYGTQTCSLHTSYE